MNLGWPQLSLFSCSRKEPLCISVTLFTGHRPYACLVTKPKCQGTESYSKHASEPGIVPFLIGSHTPEVRGIYFFLYTHTLMPNYIAAKTTVLSQISVVNTTCNVWMTHFIVTWAARGVMLWTRSSICAYIHAWRRHSVTYYCMWCLRNGTCSWWRRCFYRTLIRSDMGPAE